MDGTKNFVLFPHLDVSVMLVLTAPPPPLALVPLRCIPLILLCLWSDVGLILTPYPIMRMV
jgi:hypothetical protein